MAMLSVTDLSSFLYCERKLDLQKVFGLREPLKPALVKGSIRHAAHERVFLLEEGIVSSLSEGMTSEEISSAYQSNCEAVLQKVISENEQRLNLFGLSGKQLFQDTFPLVFEEFNERAGYVYHFGQKHNVWGSLLWKQLTPKIIAELKIVSEKLGLTGIVDRVEAYETGYVPIELKTGKSPRDGVWPGHRIQLTCYALLLEEHFKKGIKEGFVYYLDHKEKKQLAFNPFMRLEVEELINKVSLLLSSLKVPDFTLHKNKCISCGIRETCYSEQKMRELVTGRAKN
ncbi:CRISPR-associated protein Cas4 [Candidatus Woesearchaeota archaeon]|nr:CRISPR-associated protein Cas4 [Candidatus Woesearchaeota archaeon]